VRGRCCWSGLHRQELPFSRRCINLLQFPRLYVLYDLQVSKNDFKAKRSIDRECHRPPRSTCLGSSECCGCRAKGEREGFVDKVEVRLGVSRAMIHETPTGTRYLPQDVELWIQTSDSANVMIHSVLYTRLHHCRLRVTMYRVSTSFFPDRMTSSTGSGEGCCKVGINREWWMSTSSSSLQAYRINTVD
jgi:hypothetical protein